ncbi:hypothetical protein ACFVVM_32780 [Nocardia sp. NPDC058176]|uniref:hypothetical protein n=1 Tax=Nocardia sp. NPDC058176 TaxID=3346368 RepID=UPI0036DDCCF7
MIPRYTESGYYPNMPAIGTEPPRDRAEAIEFAAAAIRERLPGTWDFHGQGQRFNDKRIDAEFSLYPPSGPVLTFVVAARTVIRANDIHRLRDQLETTIAGRAGVGAMLVSRFLSPSTRRRLEDSGFSYADATGNLLLRADDAAVFISATGADSDPWRGPGRPPGTLQGEPAAKVVRALLDFDRPWKVRHLIDAADVATGSAYRVLDFLEQEALIEREGTVLTVPNWVALLRRWSEDYQFVGTNRTSRWIAPRGLPAFLDVVRGAEVPAYAFTGSIAAATWEAYAPARAAMIYAQNPESAAEAWGLRRTEKGANVVLATPAYPVLLARGGEALDGLRIAAPAQVATDLLRGPGRAPSEAEELLHWMEKNEKSWRRR